VNDLALTRRARARDPAISSDRRRRILGQLTVTKVEKGRVIIGERARPRVAGSSIKHPSLLRPCKEVGSGRRSVLFYRRCVAGAWCNDDERCCMRGTLAVGVNVNAPGECAHAPLLIARSYSRAFPKIFTQSWYSSQTGLCKRGSLGVWGRTRHNGWRAEVPMNGVVRHAE